jgi:hypothetical protein
VKSLMVEGSEDGERLRRIINQRGQHTVSGLGDRAFRQWQVAQLQTAWGRTHMCPVALESGGVLLASATRYSMSGVLDHKAVQVWAIGDLVSQGPNEADDVTRTLVEQIVAEGTASGIDVMLLFSSVHRPWLGELGFEDITPPTVSLTFPPTRRPGAPMLSIRVGEDRDLPAITAMGQVRSALYRFHLERQADFIQHVTIRKRLLAGLGSPGTRQLQFFVTEEGTIAAAYVVLAVSDGEWTVEQCGDRDPTGARVGAILQALLARDPSAPVPVLRGWLPPGFLPPQAERSSIEPSQPSVMARLTGSQLGARRLAAGDTIYWQSDVL